MHKPTPIRLIIIDTEVVKDRSIALPPLNQLLVKRLMEETRIYHLLHGYRNRTPVDLEQHTEMIMRLERMSPCCALAKNWNSPHTLTVKKVCMI